MKMRQFCRACHDLLRKTTIRLSREPSSGGHDGQSGRLEDTRCWAGRRPAHTGGPVKTRATAAWHRRRRAVVAHASVE